VAALSLVWNLGSLAVLAWPKMPAGLLDVVVALSFSVLSVLPAVLLHVSLRDARDTSWRGADLGIVAAGYTLSAVAVAMHFFEIRGNGPTLHQAALLVITFGFLVLTGGAVIRRRPGGMRILAAMCLALFATSFVHFAGDHPGQPWSAELVVHHAGIPLALLVLLQDDRFVLLDAFIRFLANAVLAALMGAAMIAAAMRLATAGRLTREPLYQALLLVCVCLSLLLFAWMRGRLQEWLTAFVFRRGPLDQLPARLRESSAAASEERYLPWSAAAMAAAVRTPDYAVLDGADVPGADCLRGPMSTRTAGLPGLPVWAEAVVPLRLGQGSVKVLALGRRQGGQRYLGEDLNVLRRAAAEIAEKVEALRQQEMNRLVSQAELRALQSQIHPHFLFNALNTLYGSIPREASTARRMVLNLAEIFRYFLQSDKVLVPLHHEIAIVRAYLEVEQLRLGNRLRVDFDIDGATADLPIPVLSVQPLVENAIKHGVARSTGAGYVRIQATRNGEGLRIRVENSAGESAAESSGAGVGLKNVERRLQICYGSAASLSLQIAPDVTVAELSVPLTGQAAGVGR
jgi:GAF domain-containing protein